MGVWLVLKVCHAGHVADHSLFIIGLDLCAFVRSSWKEVIAVSRILLICSTWCLLTFQYLG